MPPPRRPRWHAQGASGPLAGHLLRYGLSLPFGRYEEPSRQVKGYAKAAEEAKDHERKAHGRGVDAEVLAHAGGDACQHPLLRPPAELVLPAVFHVASMCRRTGRRYQGSPRSSPEGHCRPWAWARGGQPAHGPPIVGLPGDPTESVGTSRERERQAPHFLGARRTLTVAATSGTFGRCWGQSLVGGSLWALFAMSLARAEGSPPPAGQLADHFAVVCRGLSRGKLTFVLGAGASLFGRSASGDAAWEGAPSAQELAARLARAFRLPNELATSPELATVAQWIAVMRGGSMPLYDELHDVFDRDFPITPLHNFLAQVPALVRAHGGRPPLLLTTNYDDLAERALEECHEPYDLVVYMAEREHHGNFFHQPPGGTLTLIEEPKDFVAANPDERTVVLKLHGFVNRRDPGLDSYVITEDHYIEYLTRSDLDDLLPKLVAGRLRNSHLLFLGYSLRDWNLRAILYQLKQQATRSEWFAVRKDFDPADEKTWERQGVTMIKMSLEEYLAQLVPAFEAWLAEGP